MTPPATNTKATTRKVAAPTTTTKPAAKRPASKATTSKAKGKASTKPAAAKPAPKAKVEKAPTPSFASTPDTTNLIVLNDAANAARATFETEVCRLITAGVSPTHIGNVIGLGNSSVRRIAMRNGLDIK